MNRRHSHHRAVGDRRRRRGPIKRVVRGLADAFGIPRGVVIAGFVLGFISMPLLTALVFFGALYWVDYPGRIRRHAGAAYDGLKRATDRLRRRPAGSKRRQAGGGASGESSEPPRRPTIDPASLGRKFERLERRTRAIEEFVASEEFRLDREFRQMERE